MASTGQEQDDLIATLGGSLWNDLMADINLESLEKTLEGDDSANDTSQERQDDIKPLLSERTAHADDRNRRQASWNAQLFDSSGARIASGSTAPPNTPAGLLNSNTVLGAGGQSIFSLSNAGSIPFLNSIGASTSSSSVMGEPASAASFVVSHQAQRQSEINATTMLPSSAAASNAPSSFPSASQPFLNFDSSAAEAFLAADIEKKSHLASTSRSVDGSAATQGSFRSHPVPPGVTKSQLEADQGDTDNVATSLIQTLLLDSDETYNVNEEPSATGSVNLFAASQQRGPPPPMKSVPQSVAQASAPTKNDLAKSLLSSLHRPTEPTPRIDINPTTRAPSQQFHEPPRVPSSMQPPLPPGMVMTPNGPMPAAAVAAAMAGSSQFAHPPRGAPPGMIAPHQVMASQPDTIRHQVTPPQTQHMIVPGMASSSPYGVTNESGTIPGVRPNKEESKVDGEEAPEEHEGSSQSVSGRPHIIFNNPHTATTRPIPGQVAQSSLMPTRDILYVVHTILRPLLPCLADPYGEDYYFQMSLEQQQRGFMQPQKQTGTNKNDKEKVALKELKFRQVVVERAEKFQEEKQTLGHIVKSDVRRPRAILSTPVLHKMMGEGTPSVGDGNAEGSDAFSQRAQLWRARAMVDRGYQAFLRVMESHRLLMKDVHMTDSDRRYAIMLDVKEAMSDLNAAFGVTEKSTKDQHVDGATARGGIHINTATLRTALLLPKGQELLSRCLEGGYMPHPSACALLPCVLPVLFRAARPSNMSDSAIFKEERLCRSLTSLILLPNPPMPKEFLLESLSSLISASNGSQGPINLKQTLGYKPRAEVVQALLTKGGELFKSGEEAGTEKVKDWGLKEAKFLALLSAT